MKRPAKTFRRPLLAVLAIAVLWIPACGPSEQVQRRRQAQAAFERAAAHAAAGHTDEAIAGYSETIRLAPGYTNAYNSRGVLYQQQGKLDKAIADYATAIGQLPDRANLYFNRASAYQALGNEAKAQADLDQAEALAGASPAEHQTTE